LFFIILLCDNFVALAGATVVASNREKGRMIMYVKPVITQAGRKEGREYVLDCTHKEAREAWLQAFSDLGDSKK